MRKINKNIFLGSYLTLVGVDSSILIFLGSYLTLVGVDSSIFIFLGSYLTLVGVDSYSIFIFLGSYLTLVGVDSYSIVKNIIFSLPTQPAQMSIKSFPLSLYIS